MTRIRSLQDHLNRWMLAYVSLAIVVGLLAGNTLAGFATNQAGLLGGLTTAAVFMIIHPMMVNVRFEAVAWTVVSASTLRAVRSGAAWRR